VIAGLSRQPARSHATTNRSRTTRCRRRKGCCFGPDRAQGLEIFSVGKIFDVFLGREASATTKTEEGNADGMAENLGADGLGGSRIDFSSTWSISTSKLRPSQRRPKDNRALRSKK